jgi:hypothetical protein
VTSVGGSDLSAAHGLVRECNLRGDKAILAAIVHEQKPPAYDDDEFWAGRSIDGAWLADFLTSAEARRERLGVWVEGARIIGGLELHAAELTRPLGLVACQLGDHAIHLAEVRGRSIFVCQTACGGLHATDAQITGTLHLRRGFASTGLVELTGITIAGDLDCTAARFINPGGDALIANRARISGNIKLSDGLRAHGEIALVGATIGGDLDCRGAIFVNPNGHALAADRSQVTGTTFLAHGFDATGQVSLNGARVGGDLDCRGATIARPTGIALSADGIEVAGRTLLSESFSATGEVRLDGATIGGDMDCSSATFTTSSGTAADDESISMSAVRLQGTTVGGSLRCSGSRFANAGGVALDFARAHITADAILNDGFSATGTVRLPGATIGGSLKCRSSHFNNPAGAALFAHQAHVARTVFLDDGFIADGEVRFVLSTIGGDLDCADGTFKNPGRNALIIPSAEIGRSVFLHNKFNAEGGVVLLGSTIGGDLDCAGGTFTNPASDAIRAERAKVGGAVILGAGFIARGEVRLQGASFGRQLDCTGGTFTNPDKNALNADGTQIGGAIYLRDGFTASGVVSLTRASASALVDDEAAWPNRIDLDGFRYDKLYGPDRGWRKRKEWLRRQVRPSPQGYVQLAAVYRAGGEEHDARKILIERHNALLRPPSHWGNPPTRLHRAWRSLLRYTIGHGYEPWRILAIVFPLLIVMSVWYAVAAREDVFVSTTGISAVASECDSSYTCVQPVVYALDTLLPIVDLGQRAKWVPDQSRHSANLFLDGRWLAAATWTTTVLGWIFATLVVAGFTQATRRE